MNDLISRQAAIDAVNGYLRLSELSKTVRDSTSIQEILANLPPAHPKKGKWIRIVKHHKDDEQEYGYYEISCSECGAIRKIGWRDARFCPNCGAEMRSYEDEID